MRRILSGGPVFDERHAITSDDSARDAQPFCVDHYYIARVGRRWLGKTRGLWAWVDRNAPHRREPLGCTLVECTLVVGKTIMP